MSGGMEEAEKGREWQADDPITTFIPISYMSNQTMSKKLIELEKRITLLETERKQNGI